MEVKKLTKQKMKTFEQHCNEVAKSHERRKVYFPSNVDRKWIIEAANNFAYENVVEALKLSGDRLNSGLSEKEILQKLGLNG